MADYSTIVNNVNQFYTDGSAAIDYLNSQELTWEEMGQVIEASDRFNVVRNANGEVINFTQKVTSSVESGASAIDSNIGTTSAISAEIPLNATTNAAGKVTLSQMASGGLKFLTGTVAPALMAAGAGIQLGKWIDSTLYKANPQFWDEHGMSTLNPETWNNITTNDTMSGRLFNWIFGLNPETNQVQPYISQDTFAYLAGYMAQQGVFGESSTPDTIDSQYTAQLVNNNSTVNNAVPAAWYNYLIKGKALTPNPAGVPISSLTLDDTPININNNTFATYYYRNQDLGIVGFLYKVPSTFSNTNAHVLTGYYANGAFAFARSGYIVYRITINGTTENYVFHSDQGEYSNMVSRYGQIFPPSSTVGITNEMLISIIGYADLFSTESISIDGITNQTDATIFDPSGISDLSNVTDILSSLQAQFPQIWEDAVTQALPQLDPAELSEQVYVPIGLPQPNPISPLQPTADIATQSDPAPDDFPEDLLDELVDPLTTPDTDPNLPDTGTGITPISPLPTGSASALFTVYNPTQSQVDAFGAWLWSSDFVDQLKKLFNDPMESIISLHKIFGTPSTGASAEITVGYLGSGVSAATVTAQYTTVNCGTVTLKEYFGNVYDYNNTAVELYLPFIGIVPLSVSDVMRGTLTVKYSIDVLTGACLAEVEVIRDAAGGVIYQYSGDCAVHYPVSSGSYIGIVGGLLSVAAGVGGTIASGGATAPLLLGAGASIMRTHTDVARSGGFSANSGAMGAKKPYLIISRPQTALPSNYLAYEGIGSNQTITLSQASGYVKIKDVQLNGISQATQEELAEIEGLLKSGVII